MLISPSILGLLAGIGALGFVSATCYNPDGTVRTDPAYQPCNQVDGTISQCCGTNHTGGVVAVDRCLSNGLCQNTGDNVYWRGGCTDRTFKSKFCLNICLDEDGGSSSDNAPLKLCSGGSWCCSVSGQGDCCAKASLKFNLAATIGSSPSSSTISSATTSQTSNASSKTATTSSSPGSSNTALPNVSSSPSPTPSNPPETKKTNIVGIAVGVPLAVLFVAAIVGCIIYLRRRRSKTSEGTNEGGSMWGKKFEMDGTNQGGSRSTKRFEMEDNTRPTEVRADTRGRFELAS